MRLLSAFFGKFVEFNLRLKHMTDSNLDQMDKHLVKLNLFKIKGMDTVNTKFIWVLSAAQVFVSFIMLKYTKAY